MASAVIPPRQLAPTVGPAAALAGVFIRTGSLIASGERVVCGLVRRFGALNFIDDNAGCFGNKPFPRNGCLILFGGHEVYVATEVVSLYPESVCTAEDPPAVLAARDRHWAGHLDCMEVMVTASPTATDKIDTGDTDVGTKSISSPLGRPMGDASHVGASDTVVDLRPSRSEAEKLTMPVAHGINAVSNRGAHRVRPATGWGGEKGRGQAASPGVGGMRNKNINTGIGKQTHAGGPGNENRIPAEAHAAGGGRMMGPLRYSFLGLGAGSGNYATTINVTGSNGGMAICYAPIIMTGSARTRANNMLSRPISHWTWDAGLASRQERPRRWQGQTRVGRIRVRRIPTRSRTDPGTKDTSERYRAKQFDAAGDPESRAQEEGCGAPP